MKNADIDNGKEFNWGLASKDYAKYRDIYPDEFYEKIVDLGQCVKGQKVLDLGTGTGVLPRNMYKYGAEFIGADIAENQIVEARKLAAEQKMEIKFIVAPAEKTNQPSNYFDVITACQCFFYFDKAKVLPEIARMLKPNGHFLILFMAWLPFESEIAKMSEELVLKYNPAWTGGSTIRSENSVPDWSNELFTCENMISYDINVPFTREGWHGRMKACRGIGASLSAEKVAEFDKEHMQLLEKIAPKQFEILHFVTIHDFKVKK
jgi:SAM-dependent methyltransferase